MRVPTTGGLTAAALILLCQLTGSAAAASEPYPERNPLRETGLPLPERNPVRETELPLPERNPVREAELPLPERNPLRVVPEASAEAQRGKGGRWPKLLPGAPEILTTWSEEEIGAARAHCAEVLKGIDAVTEPAEPVRNGGCGSAGPVKLVSIGKEPQVMVSPPAILTCDLVAALVDWMKKDVQPTARRLLGKPVTKISNISDYSCRTSASRTSTRLSEHALANALDIRDFITEDGQVADLKRDWGPTARDIAAQIAAEKAAEAARRAAVAAAEAAAKAAKEVAAKKEAAAKQASKNDGDRKTPDTGAGAQADAETVAKTDDRQEPAPPPAVDRSPPNTEALSPRERRRLRREERQQVRLATKAVAKEAARAARDAPSTLLPVSASLAAAAEKPSPPGQFLREIHEAACGTFGTVLGPEANEAHRDHFHLDMAKRRYKSFCE